MPADEFANKHWLLIFRDRESGIHTGYDARVPLECLQVVLRNNPELEFRGMRGFETANTAIELTKAMKAAAKMAKYAEAEFKAHQASATI